MRILFDNLVDMLQARSGDAVNGYFHMPEGSGPEDFLSFNELDRRARALACQLRAQGLAGQRALLCYPSGVEFMVGLFGCVYGGVVAVPAYPPRAHRNDPRLDSIVENCTPAIVLTNREVHRDLARYVGKSPRLAALTWLDTTTVAAELADGWRDPKPARGDLVALQYTSGSTGHPKGVMLNHGCLLHNLARMRDVLGLAGANHGVCWLPTFHDMGLVGNYLQALNCGVSLTCMSPAAFAHDPIRWLRAISQKRAFVSGGPCFAFQHCVNRMTAKKCEGLDLSCWKVAYVGAEPVSAAVLDRFVETFAPYGYRRETFFPCYGLAEATLMVTGGDFRAAPIVRGFRQATLEENRAELDAAGRQLIGCGEALEDMDVRIVDPNTRLPMADGHIGEIWAAGPSVAGGYWNRAEESAELFAARRTDGCDTPYLRTGDFGFLHEGELFISGRLKDLIIIRGRNFHPQDLESAVEESIPELRGLGAAAFAVEADPVARLVMVQEAPRTFKAGQGQDLFLKARQAVAEQFELELSKLAFIKMASIPRASSGKVRRSETQRQYLAGTLDVIETVEAPEPVEEPAPEPAAFAAAGMEAAIRDWLVARLSRRLGIPPEQIDRDRPFAAYMLDSMMMVSLAADLEQWIGRPLSPTLLYTAPTIASLARKLAGETRVEDNGEFQGPAPVPIAVVGIGCRFPCADNPDEFWQLLCDGRDGVGDLPAGRWTRIPRSLASTRAGYLGDVEHFDAPFFGIAPREAVFIDPQHRLLLEVAWEALEHAGLAPERLAGKTVGAFVGISNSDYGRVLTQHTGYADAYLGTGNSPSMAAHRLSYHLDLHGPSVAVDTACSSSLVSVHLACQSIRNGECELALAGGVNLLLAPDLTEALSRAGMLSPTARCKTFDNGADGYVRGEGCGLIVLKPLLAAIRDGDQVFAVLEASLVNQDGRSNGITAPNGGAQTELIRRTLRLAHRQPADVSYIETHGTGTPLGDPIEFDGLNDAIGATEQPCLLASVKTNVGHLEAAAGIVGLIKTILQIHHGKIVPHLHLDELNARINLAGSRFRIPRELQAWEGPGRVAGVSSFGFGGTNAHILASQAPAISIPASSPSTDRTVHCLPLSARSEQALRELAGRYLDWFGRNRDAAPADVCATAAQGRSHFANRLVVQGGSLRELGDSLQRWLDGKRDPRLQIGTARPELVRHLALLFTGQGAQYVGMGKQLYESCPIFREQFDRCDAILRGQGYFSVREALDSAMRLDGTDVAQPALFALEYSLAQTWRQWGIEPAAVLGHSVGEYVAACVAGVFSLEDGLRLIAERGKLMQSCPEGTMLACFASLAEIQERLERWRDFLSIAAINGPESIVLAGDAGVMAAFQEELAAFNIETRPLHVHRAFHSRLIEPALPTLREVAAGIAHHTPRIRLISNKTGDFFQVPPDAVYWAEHARLPVQFARGIQTLHEAGITHFLEIGPEAVLSRLGPTCLAGHDAVWLPSLRRGKDDWQGLLASLGKLYVDGAAIDWERFDGQRRRRVVLPTYPFQRQRYWFDDLPRAAVPAAEMVTTTPLATPSEIAWQPRSNWSEGLPRLGTGFDKLTGGLEGVASPVVAKVKGEHDVGMFSDLREEFDRLAGGYVANTLKQLGWRPGADERFQTEQLAERCKVQPAYHRLLARLLEIAAEDGWLANQAGVWRVLRMPAAVDIQSWHEDFTSRRADFAVELKLAHRCATQMHAVMRGEQDPLQVLFGEGAGQLTEQLYEKSPLSRFYNELLAECVAKLLLPLAERRPIRILEVGAGTGGTTTFLLPRLPAERTEYVFTDVSQLFLARAKDKFRDYPFVDYRLFDAEKEPASQGFADGQFDMVMGANVFHATGDLRRSLRNVRRLLAPAGLLVMLEGTGRRRLLDMIFGLTDGWWKFQDADLRQGCPLLSPASWTRLLGQEDFPEVAIVPVPDKIMPDPDQAVVLARAAEVQRAEPLANGVATKPVTGTPATPAGTTWLALSDRSELADRVTARLERVGANVVRVNLGDMYAWEGRDRCWIRAGEQADVDALLAECQERRAGPIEVIDFSESGSADTWPGVERHWVVTRGAAPLGGEGQGNLAWQAWLDGRQDASLRLVDVDPETPVDAQAAAVLGTLLHHDEEPVRAYRGDQRYVPRRASETQTGGAPIAAIDRQALLAASPFDRRAMVESYLRREFANVLGLELAAEDLDKPLQAFGLDSLMGIQFRNRVEAGLGVSLSIVDFLKGLSLGQIVENSLRELAASAEAQAARPKKEAVVPGNLTADKVSNLSEGELDNLLQSLMDS